MTLRRRWVLFIGLPLYTVLMVPPGTVMLALASRPSVGGGAASWLEDAWDLLIDPEWWGVALISCAIIAASQFVFLLPVVRLTPPTGTRSRRLSASLLVGAGLAAVLTLGLGLALVELLAALIHGGLPDDSPWPSDGEMLDQGWALPAAFVILLGSWGIWAGALLIFTRRLWADSVLGRLVALLFGGTVVELLVVLPIDAMVRRRTDCYCATGTFFSLILSAVAVIWLTGPGIVLALTARRRRLVRKTHCARCGQPKGPSPGPVCPECGYAWRGREGRPG